MLKSVRDIESPAAGPSWWRRQNGETGLVWEDRSLVQNWSNPYWQAEVQADPVMAEPHPEVFEVGKFGLLQSSHHNQHVLSYENWNKVSQADWAHSVLDQKM